MRFELLYVLFALKLSGAHYAFAPKFYAQDSAIIVDTDKALPQPLTPQRAHHAEPHYRPVQSYPVYQIIALSSSSTSTTAAPPPSSAHDEFPRELLDIAQHRLGLKRLDEIPSISELGEMLGTTGAAETIKYIRQLTANAQGIALIKSYLESYDFTDSTTDRENRQSTDRKHVASLLAPQQSDEAALMPQAPQSFFERMVAYLNVYNILPQHRAQLEAATKSLVAHDRKAHNHHQHNQRQRQQRLPPQSGARYPLPHRFPVPIRRGVGARGSTHLNTPKVFVPHIQLAKMANIPPKKLESMLQHQPKLAALAEKVSRLPEAHAGGGNDAQLLAAVQRAIEQDEDLKKLLASSETLK